MTESHVRRDVNLIGVLALALADSVRHATEQAAGHSAAGPGALVALREFANGRSVTQLSDVLGLTHSGTVRLVDRLEADGYVERVAGASGREVAVRLTAAGGRAARRVRDARANAVDDVLRVLNPRERVELARLVERLVGSIATQRLEARAVGEPPTGGWMCRLCDFAGCGRAEGRCPVAHTAS